MEKFKFINKNKIDQLPRISGVYCFKKDRELFYIGKARNIKERVKNHLYQPTQRDNFFLKEIKKVGFIETNSEIEALLLEAKLIKKYQPKFNILWRDDKNYFYVAILTGKFPQVLITHQPHQKPKTINHKLKTDYFGPFVDGAALKKTLLILRRIFPYYSTKKHPKDRCLYCHLGLCPGPSADDECRKNINNLSAVLRGKKELLLRFLRKNLEKASRKQNFEKAAKIRNQVWALEKTISNAKVIETDPVSKDIQKTVWRKTENILRKITAQKQKILRIEGYDVSNIQGKDAAGSLVVFFKGLPDKKSYRKFKIKLSEKPDDIAMIKEVLRRRLKHSEWPYPEIILIDGGRGQLNAAISVKNEPFDWRRKAKKIRVLAIAKKNNELYLEGRKPFLLKALPRGIFNLILQIRDESHRFARTYHHKIRMVDFGLKS